MEKVNLGIIGIGSVGKTHLENSLYLKNTELIGVADVSKNALLYAKKLGVKQTYSNYKDLLKNKKINAVIIATPTYLHYDCVKEAAEKRMDIFIEKPLARNYDEGKLILSCARAAGVKLMVGYPLVFSENFKKLRNNVKRGRYGTIVMASANNLWSGPFRLKKSKSGPLPVPEWWFDKKLTGGGALLDLGSHMINLLRWFFGDVTNVKSYLGYRFNLDFEDHALCILKFKEGIEATVKVGWFSREPEISIDLHGVVKHATEKYSVSSSVLNFGINQIKKQLSMPVQTPYYNELKYFSECIHTDCRPFPSGEDALSDLKIISRAYENSSSLNLKEF